jgi:hypothetical protein
MKNLFKKLLKNENLSFFKISKKYYSELKFLDFSKEKKKELFDVLKNKVAAGKTGDVIYELEGWAKNEEVYNCKKEEMELNANLISLYVIYFLKVKGKQKN